MKKYIILLFFSLTFLIAKGQTSQEFDKMNFLIGKWEFSAKSLLPDGSFQNQLFYSNVEKIFNGRGHKDNFQYKDKNGNLVSYGYTVRTYDDNTEQWKMLWYNYNLSFLTEMVGKYDDDEFNFTGKGIDEKGKYIEKITFYNIDENSYSWKSDKSYDGGESWLINFFSYDAKRIE